jgi:hypothetical protein
VVEIVLGEELGKVRVCGCCYRHCLRGCWGVLGVLEEVWSVRDEGMATTKMDAGYR